MFHKNEGFRYSSIFAIAALQSCYEDKFLIRSDMKILCQNRHSKNLYALLLPEYFAHFGLS